MNQAIWKRVIIMSNSEVNPIQINLVFQSLNCAINNVFQYWYILAETEAKFLSHVATSFRG